MNATNLRLLAVSLAALTTLSLAPLKAQDNFTNGDAAVNPGSWSDALNWSSGVPVSSSLVVIAVAPPVNAFYGAPTILEDTDNPGGDTIASLSFGTSGTPLATTLTIAQGDGIESLIVNGAITNFSPVAINLILPMSAVASATYAGGPTGGSLNFGKNLDLQGNAITMTGTVTVGAVTNGPAQSLLNDSVGGATLTIGATGTAGTVTLTGPNTFGTNTLGGDLTDCITIANGTLSVPTLAAVGTAQPLGEATTVTLAGGSASAPGILQYTGGVATLFQNVTVTTNDFGTISNTGGALLTLSGTLSKNGSVLNLSGGAFNVTGQITGSSAGSDLNVIGASTVTLSNTDTYNGPTSVSGNSSLITAIAGALPTPTFSVVTLGAASDTRTTQTTNTLDLDGTAQTIGGLSSIAGTAGINNFAVINQVVNSNGASPYTTANGTAATLTISPATGVTNTFAGSLGGTGASNNFGVTLNAADGTGVQVLTGANTYTGATNIEQGTLQLGSGGSLASTTAVTLGNSTGNTSGVLALGNGGGAVSQTISSLTTSGAGTGNAVVGGSSSVSTLTVNTNSSDVFGGVIGGAGANQNNLALAVSGTGSLVLTGNNTYTGITTINAGSTLQLGNGGTTGIIHTASISDNGSFVLDHSNNIDDGGIVVSGSGSLTQAGSSQNVITANDTYTGGTTISNGGLIIGHNATTGNIAGNVLITNSTSYLGFDRSDASFTFGGTISGAGFIEQFGSGILNLTATNSYSGGTSISTGTIQVAAADTNLGTGYILLVGGELLTTTTSATSKLVALSTGADTLAAATSTTATYNGVIENNGANVGTLTIGDATNQGTVVFTAANTYTGITTIASGSTLQVGNGGTTGGIASASIVDNGSFVFDHSDNLSQGIAVSGSGSMTQAGSGQNVITATDTYTGGTIISNGSLVIGNGGATGSIVGNVTIASGSYLGFDHSDNITFSGNISGSGYIVQFGSNILNLTGNNSSLTGGADINTGTIQVAAIGANLGTGVIDLFGGELLTTTTSASSNIIGLATGTDTLAAATPTTATYNGLITNQTLASIGQLTVGDATNHGTVVFTAANTYTGGTTVSGGSTLGVANTTGSATGAGAVTLNSGANLQGAAGSNIAGQVNLNGNNTISSTAGTMTVGSLNIVAGTSNNTLSTGTVAGNATQNAGSSFTVNGTLTGTDSLTAGATALSGTGTVSGAVTMNGGGNTISGSGGGLSTGGVIVNNLGNTIGTGTVNGAITQNSSSGLTVNGVGGTDALANLATLAGTGTVGAVTLAGNNTLSSTGTLTTGGITVSGLGNSISTGIVTGPITFSGTSALTVNGTASGTVAVGNNATLSGIGTTGAVTVAGGGNINLQNGSIGTLTVGGLTSNGTSGTPSSFSFDLQTVAGTTTVDHINDTGTLTLTNANGTTITIDNLSSPTSPVNGTSTYALLTYTGTQQSLGDFDLLTTSLDGKTLALSQTGDTIYLDISNPAAAYTLAASATNSRIMVSTGSTTITSTITNTGAVGTVNFTGLNAALTGTPPTGSALGTPGTLPIASGSLTTTGASASGTATLTAGSGTGAATITPTVGTVTDTASGSPGVTTTTATVDIVANRTESATSVALGRVMVGQATSPQISTITSATGQDASLTRITVGANPTVTGVANGTLTLTGAAYTFGGANDATNSTTESITGNFTTAGTQSGTAVITPTGEGLAGESVNTIGIAYTADAVNNRTESATSVNLGRVLVGQTTGSQTTTISSVTGDDSTLTRTTLAAGSQVATGVTNGTITLGSGTAYQFGSTNDATNSTTRGVTGSFTTAGTQTGTAVITPTGEGLTGEAVNPIDIAYTVDPVNLRTITNGAVTSLGTLHSDATINNVISNPFTTSGTHDTTTDVTVAAGSGTSNGVTLSGGLTTFNGGISSDTRTFGGAITNASGGTTTGSFSLAVTTLETGLGDTYANVTVAYTANVYTGVGVWNFNGGGTWGTVASPTPDWTANGGTPGLDSNFTTTDSATFGNVLTSGTASVTLGGDSPSLNTITFDNTLGASYNITPTGGGTLKLNNGAGTAAITDTAGNNTISAPMEFDSNVAASVARVGDTLTLSGAIGEFGGSKSLSVSGAGTVVLSGQNTYSGGTTVNAGTVVAGNSTVTAAGSITNGPFGTGTLTLGTGATLKDNGTAITLANPLSLSGTITLASTGSGSLDFDGTALTTPATVTLTGATTLTVNNTTTIADNISGNFGFSKLGTGTLILTGVNSGTGPTNVTSGTLVVSGPGSLSSGTVTLAGGTTLQYTDGAATLSQNITVSSGSATISNTGGGLLTLGGTLDKNGTTLILNGGANGIKVTGQITGATAGSDLVVTGGTTTLTNLTNNYNGPTYVQGGGTLVDGTPGTGATLPTATTLYIGGTDNTTGTFDLDGNNQTIAGLASQGTGGAANVVTNNGTLDSTLTVTAGGAFAGTIQDGGTNKTGIAISGGTMVLTGANTYSGGTTITASTLQVGSATALGTGSVTNSGTLETVGAQHVINVGGSYTQNAGGKLVLNLNAVPDPVTGLNAANDVLNVTGTATLNGTLSVDFKFLPKKGQTFEVVETGAGINGTPGANFSAPIVSPAGYTVTTSESGNSDDFFVTVLTTNLQLTTIPGISLTPNQTNLALYLANPNLATSDPALFNAFQTIIGNPQAVEAALDQLSPEKFGNFTRSNVFNNVTFSTQLFDSYFESQRSPQGNFMAGNGQIDSSGLTALDPSMDPCLAQVSSRLLAWSPAPLGHGMLSDTGDPVLGGIDMNEMTPMTGPDKGYNYNVFVLGNVVLAQNFSQPGVAHADTTTGAVQVGIDYKITPHLRVGATFGYGHTDADLDNIGSKAAVDSYAPGAYVSFADNGWYANALGSYGFDSFSEDRHVSFGGLTGIAHGAPNGDQIVGNLDGGYDFHVKKWTFGPLAGIQYTHLDVDSFTENGAAPVNLQVNKQETDSLRSRLGGHLSYDFHAGKVVLTPHLDASWQHEFMDQSRGITSQFTSVGAGSFTINTPNPSRESALIDCGLNADLNGQISLFLDYLVQAGQSNYFGQSVQGGAKVGF